MEKRQKGPVSTKTFFLLVTTLLLLLQGFGALQAQNIRYGTGNWDRNKFGNHRAVIEVHTDATTVLVHIPWQRQDNPAGKAVILVEAKTGKQLYNFRFQKLTPEAGDLAFQPLGGKGIYYLYYMPYKTTGSWYFPNTIYPPATDSADPFWEKTLNNLPLSTAATVLRFEDINAFNAFHPMETVATVQEVDQLLKANKDKDFLLFPEDRAHPIRMDNHIPERWARRHNGEAFHATALKNEFFVFQVGVYAPFKDLQNIRLGFTDLTSKNGAVLPAGALRCFNLSGSDWLGNPFTKRVDLHKGGVQAMWVGLDIPKGAQPGSYEGEVAVSVQTAGGAAKTSRIKLHIDIKDSVLADRGYADLSKMARLNWLDAKIGLDDSIYKPYIPLILHGHRISALGRTVQFNHYGLPERITSSFTGSNDRVDGPAKDILKGPVQVLAFQNNRPVRWTGDEPAITEKTAGAVSWKGTYKDRHTNTTLQIAATMECDGYINYSVQLSAEEDISLSDIQLLIPYSPQVARYRMGLGVKGGRFTDHEHLDWKWDSTRANNMFWIGDVNAGLQCKLKNETPDWSLSSFSKTGPYKDWSNDGKGGCSVAFAPFISSARSQPDSKHGHTKDSILLLKAYTGPKTLHKGQVVHLNFGLLVTPVKPLDNSHWSERYFQADPPIDSWRKTALAKGANIMNVHQGNLLNPYINYPFLTTDTLKKYIAANRRAGIRTKLYYTVRELSNHAAEIWALRSMGDEIFTPGVGAQVANQFEDDGLGGNLHATGGSWIVEHLRTKYDAAWHTPLADGENDMAIRTQGLSRWHNYYLEGLGWLIKNTGARGIYLDGVGYDREIMKRVRKVMDRAADSCLIDFHSGNNFSPSYGMNSPMNQYMELMPCINTLWLGEGYNYDESPDYYLTEISGIPYGLYSEMLNGCGNAYRGMIYGMTSRLGWTGCDPSALWKLWDSFGIQSSRMTGYWDPAIPVKSSNEDVKVTVYQKNDKILIAYASWAKKDVTIQLQLNMASLGMDPDKIEITAPEVKGLQVGRQFTSYKDLNHLNVSAGKGGFIIITKKGR